MKTQNLLSLLFFISVVLSSCGEKCVNAPVILAGNDTIIYNTESITLKASTDADAGHWTIVSGDQGVLEEATSPKTLFSGALNNSYTLVWSSENKCGISTDTIKVSFLSQYTVTQMVDSIVWIQQSCFRIKGAQLTVYTDPQAIKTGAPMADVILITHSDGDHFSVADIKKIANEKTVVYGPADCKYTGTCKEFITVKPGDSKNINPGFSFKAVSAYNSKHPQANNFVGYVFTLNGVIIYHAGDTKRIPEMKDITCNIAMMPLGQTYTMSSVQEAVDAVKDVKASVAIPMHYGLYEGKASDAVLFSDLLAGFAEVVIKTRE
jgi:L-ascorbate metabolism protein UlaG (beta-lactamase superfamily)